MTDLDPQSDPQFVRYAIPPLVIDGPACEEGWVEVKLLCEISRLGVAAATLSGMPLQLAVRDWAGPLSVPDPRLAPPEPPDEELPIRGAAVIAATVHDILHPEAPWDSLSRDRRLQLLGVFTRLIVDGVIDVGPAVLGHGDSDG